MEEGRSRVSGGARQVFGIVVHAAKAPDGRHLLYAQYDQSGSNIMMVEDFR
jgi:hypothetical protein